MGGKTKNKKKTTLRTSAGSQLWFVRLKRLKTGIFLLLRCLFSHQRAASSHVLNFLSTLDFLSSERQKTILGKQNLPSGPVRLTQVRVRLLDGHDEKAAHIPDSFTATAGFCLLCNSLDTQPARVMKKKQEAALSPVSQKKKKSFYSFYSFRTLVGLKHQIKYNEIK